jgi:hypothetical protein
MVTLVTAALTVVAPAAGAANGDCRLIRGAGTPSDTTDDISVCRQDTWIHRATTPLGNLAGVGADASPSWNTTKPDASLQEGAGGIYLTDIIARGANGRDDKTGLMVVEGTYKGTLDNIAIELFGFVTTEATGRLNLRLDIDGVTIFEAVRGIRDDGTVVGQPVEYRFVYTNLYRALEAHGKQGDATTEHRIRVGVAGYTIGQDPILFVYDTAEQPAGLVFNLEDNERSSYTAIDVTE